MKIDSVKLVYFSPTGTTKKIIESIVQGIEPSTMETVDITKPEARKHRLETSENELLIIGVPVHYGRIPTTATEWLDTIEAHNTPTICVVVYGNREYDDALLELKDTAVKNGCIPIGCAAYIGEHSFSNDKTPIAAGRPDANELKQAELFGKKVKEKILSISSISQVNDITVPGNNPYKKILPLSPIDFIIVDDNCTQCGACAQECPVGAINPENTKSIDTKKCICCCACIKNCPTKARSIKSEMAQKAAVRMSQLPKRESVFFL